MVDPSTYNDFQCHDLDDKHKCTHCHLVSPVKDWQCNCGLKWFLCPEHKCANGAKGLPAPRIVSVSPPIVRRPRVPTRQLVTFDQLLEEDLRRASSQGSLNDRDPGAIINLKDGGTLRGPGAARLGPILARRFGRANPILSHSHFERA